MIKLSNYIKYKTCIYNILSISSFILLGIIAISLVNPETSITYAIENSGNPENSEDNNSDIALFANTTTPTASLEISNSGDNTILANPDSGTVYSTHSITMSSVNISNYTLSISAPAELKSVSGKTTLSGAGDATGNSMANNTWGYSYDKTGSISDAGNLAYSSFTGSTQNLESGTTPTASSRNLILAAKFGDNAEAGHYAGTVNLLLTATPKTLTTYSVSYNCNSGTGCPSNYSESSYDDSITYTIPSTTPTRSGYNFLGYNITNSSTADSTYAPGKTITLTSASSTRTLYAAWEQQGLKSITTMQQMTTAICTASAVGDTAKLKDTRDNKSYTVAKLKDGKCWMTQNLRLAGGTQIFPSNSDISASAYNLPAATTAAFSSDNTAQQMRNSTNDSNGAYYSWCAATAGTCQSGGSPIAADTNASSSICPKGWRLPKGTPGTGTNEFASMAGLSSMNIAANTNYWSSLSSPSLTSGILTVNDSTWVADGHMGGGSSSIEHTGIYGYYWSSTASSTTNAYYLNFGGSGFTPALSSFRCLGFSVRCIAK